MTTLEQQYRKLKTQAKSKQTAQLPRQRRETLAMIQALKMQTAAGDDQELHGRVEQLLLDFEKGVALFTRD